MKKLIIAGLMLVGCATTAKETYLGKYEVGNCVRLTDVELALRPPQFREHIKAVTTVVSDKGNVFYVVEGKVAGAVVFREIVEFKQLEDVTVKVECEK